MSQTIREWKDTFKRRVKQGLSEGELELVAEACLEIVERGGGPLYDESFLTQLEALGFHESA